MLNFSELAQKKLDNESDLTIANLFMQRDCINLHEPILKQSIVFLSPQTEKSYRNFLMTTPETLFWYQNGVMKTLGVKTDPTSPFAEVIDINGPVTAQLFKEKVEKMFEGLLKHLECLQIRYNTLEKDHKRLSMLVHSTPANEKDAVWQDN